MLTPGRHTNLPVFGNKDQVVLKQASAGNDGIYYIDGGGFKSTGAKVTMDSGTTGGVMIYNDPHGNNDGIQITGNPDGRMDLTPLTDGPYQGMVLWQRRDGNIQPDVQVEGNGDFSVRGTFYAAGALVKITGSATTATGFKDDRGNTVSGGSRIGSQYISRNLSLAGNGNIFINYRGPEVARTRIITLVE